MVGHRIKIAAVALLVAAHAPHAGAARGPHAAAEVIDVHPPARAPLPMVVTTDWLAQHYRDADVVLLQVGERGEYDKEHIPGARFIEMNDVSTPHNMDDKVSLMLEFPAPEALRATFAKLGVSDNSHVVVYYGNDWLTPTTRMIHTLNYIGLGDHVSILDGGMQAWKKAGKPVNAEVVTAKPGTLKARATNDVTVTGDWVRSHLKTPGIAIIDARSRNFYDGKGMGNDRKGHIPGAVSLSYEEITTEDMVLYDKATLAKKFADAGIKPTDTIIAYCHVGQQATAVVFAARLLGRNVKLYDGSFQDWNSHAEYPVENPSAKADGK